MLAGFFTLAPAAFGQNDDLQPDAGGAEQQDAAPANGPVAMSPDGLWSTFADADAAQAHRATLDADLDANAADEQHADDPWVRPEVAQAALLDLEAVARVLADAPLEGEAPAADTAPTRLALPRPDGTFETFDVVEAPVMAPGLQARYPQLRTYLGIGVDDPSASARISLTPSGFAAQVLSTRDTYYIDRFSRNDRNLYVSYRRSGMKPHAFTCGVAANGHQHNHGRDITPTAGRTNLLTSGSQLRTYRLAVATTGEYAQFHGGTVASALDAVVVAVNRVTGIYEAELAIRLVLIDDNDQLIFLNAATDPFSNNNPFNLLSQNQSTLDSIVGNGAYDVGHNFSTGGGGVASLGSVCVSSRKAQGVTGLPQPIGDVFWVDYAAHELGHQFGANHTFNGVNGSCSGGNRNGSTAYEPGSANTIMGYAGICGADNVQPNSDPIFHSISYDEMRAYITTGAGANCGVVTSTGNDAPTVDAGPAYAIPVDTPFTLTASGSDPNGDPLTFAWEQRDLGPAAPLDAPDDGQIPLFRAFEPTTSPSRTFPRLTNILSGIEDDREKLPKVARSMQMRVTARDNNPVGGGVAFDETTISVVGSAGPFVINQPSPGVLWGGVQVVQWDVAGTNASPINAANVDILLSTDDGQTFDVLLADDTPNDGSQLVQLPAATSSQTRIKVAASDNIFFDISPRFDLGEVPLTLALLDAPPTVVDPGVVTTIDVIAATQSTRLDGPPELFISIDGDPFASTDLSPLGNDTFRAVLPALACGETLEWYIAASTLSGESQTLPDAGAGDPFQTIPGENITSFSDDFEADLGWTVSSTASSGAWQRGVPVNADRGDPPADFDGSGQAYLTENVPGNTDVDDGSTTLTSPALDLAGGATLAYAYWLNDIPNGRLGAEDFLRVQLSGDGGSTWTTVRTYGAASSAWRTDAISVTGSLATANARVRFIAADNSPGDVVEAGVDAVSITSFSCTNPPKTCPTDLDGSGATDGADLVTLLAGFGNSGPGAPDVTGDGAVDGADLVALLAEFGKPCP
jgi:hypothetical protein